MLPLFAAATHDLSLNIHITWWAWALLVAWFTFLILFDLLVVHRKDTVADLKTSVIQSLVWIGLGVFLGVVILLAYGHEAGVQYFSGYLIEKSLSIDNVFAWSVILTYFAVPRKYQHRVLFWGIFGAIIMRIVFVFAGVAVIHRFESILLVFGAILVFSGIKMLKTHEEDEFNPEASKFLKLAKKFIPVSHKLDGHKLFTIENGKRVATMLFMALLVVEFTDVIFAVDSVPAILAISNEPFIIIASNAAAILGMRSLYFVFEEIKDKFWMLTHALGILLLFVGTKMLIAPEEVFGRAWFGIHIPTGVSLLVILLLLGGAIVGSLIFPQKPHAKE